MLIYPDDEFRTILPGRPLPDSFDKKIQLFYDEIGCGYFWATATRVIEALYHLNRNFLLRGWCLLAEFYEMLNIYQDDFSKTHGWSSYEMECDGYYPWLDVSFFKDNKAGCYKIVYDYVPTDITRWEEH